MGMWIKKSLLTSKSKSTFTIMLMCLLTKKTFKHLRKSTLTCMSNSKLLLTTSDFAFELTAVTRGPGSSISQRALLCTFTTKDPSCHLRLKPIQYRTTPHETSQRCTRDSYSMTTKRTDSNLYLLGSGCSSAV